MGLEQETRTFIERLQENYFAKRDLAAVLDTLSDDISWLGIGEKEWGNDKKTVAEALETERAMYSGRLTVAEQELTTRILGENLCMMYGRMCAVSDDQAAQELELHATLVCERTPQGMRLIHANFSRPDTVQGCFAPRQSGADAMTLRTRLQSQERQLENIMRNMPGGAHQCAEDAELSLLGMSDGFLTMFGYTREEIHTLFDNKFLRMVHPLDRAGMFKSTCGRETGETFELEYRVICKDGHPMWVLDKGRLVSDSVSGRCYYCVLIEIDDSKREQEELRLSLERHQVILDQATDIIFEWDIVADTLLFSPNWRKKFGYDPIDTHISGRIPLSQNIHPDDIAAFVKIMQDTSAGVPYSETEFRIQDSSGRFFWCRVRVTTQFDSDHQPIKAVGVITDISTEKKEKQELLEMAQHDALTGLYNKSAVRAQIELRTGDSGNGRSQALLMIDLDNFKQVNDTYGHLCGDALLSEVAETLKRHFRVSDLIGRIGGDEFLVYLSELSEQGIALEKAQSLLEKLGQVTPAKGAQPVSCSIGVAVFAHGEADYLTMYHCADQALYCRKKAGKKGVSLYDPSDFPENVPGNKQTYSALGAAIDSDRLNDVDEKLAQYAFRMLYQSIDVKTAVNHILEIVGRAYDVSRAYIFEDSEDGKTTSNTFEWCAPGTPSAQPNLQNLPYEGLLGNYMGNFGEDGVFYCRDISTLSPRLYELLAPQGVRSLLQCAIFDGGVRAGYVGFDECRENRYWTREQIATLTMISNMVAVFLTKQRNEERIKRLCNQRDQWKEHKL